MTRRAMMEKRQENEKEEQENARRRTKEILRRLFDEIDTDHSGFIEYNELKVVMADRGGFQRQELDGVWLSLVAVDDNHDGRVSFPEFERAFRPLVERQLRRKNWIPFLGKKQKTQDAVTMDRLLNEWQGLAENLNIGCDISIYTPPPQQRITFPYCAALTSSIFQSWLHK